MQPEYGGTGRRRRHPGLWIAACCLVAACGDDGGGSAVAGTTAGTGDQLTDAGTTTTTVEPTFSSGAPGSTSQDGTSSTDESSTGATPADAEVFAEVLVYEEGPTEWSAAAIISHTPSDVLVRVMCETGSGSYGSRACLPLQLPEAGQTEPLATSTTLGDEVDASSVSVMAGPIRLAAIGAGGFTWWYAVNREDGAIPEGTVVSGGILGSALNGIVEPPGSVTLEGDTLDWDPASGSGEVFALAGDTLHHLDAPGPMPEGTTRAFRLTVTEGLHGAVWLRVVALHTIQTVEE